MRRSLSALLGLCFLLAAAPPAEASVRPSPLKLRFVPDGLVAPDAARLSGQLQLLAAEGTVVEGFTLQQRGRELALPHTVAGRSLEVDRPLSLPLELAAGPGGSIVLQAGYQVDGEWHERRLDLSPARIAATQRGGRLIPALGGGAAQGAAPLSWPEPDDPHQPARDHHEHHHPGGADDPGDPGPAAGSAAGRNIRITGQAFFRHAADPDGLYPFYGARIEVWDADNGPDEKFATGYAFEDGSFDFNAWWNPCFLCDSRPDIYLKVVARSEQGRVDVESPELEITYRWNTSSFGDYEGSELDFGGIATDSDHPAAHIYSLLLASRDELTPEGYFLDNVDVQWPEDGDGAYYNNFWEEIHISPDREWFEPTILHEYGHHWHYQYASPGSHDYCNGTCDSGGDCGHCMWCPEDNWSTVKESMAHFLAWAVTDGTEYRLGWDFFNQRDGEFVQPCGSCGCNPYLTEGYLFSFLRDVGDYEDENDPGMDPVWEDKSRATRWQVLAIMDQFNPSSAADWFSYLRYNRFGGEGHDLWSTARNNGLEFDFERPGIAQGLRCLSHVVGEPSPKASLVFTWGEAPDDVSGIAGYAMSLSTDPGVEPGTSIDLPARPFSHTTEPLAPGSWYFKLRAVDHSGKSSLNVATIGPLVVREPQLSDLHMHSNGSFPIPVVPQLEAGNGVPGVPGAMVPANPDPSWWAFQFQNDGESSIQDPTTARLELSGGYVVDEFTLPGAGPGQVTGIFDRGPVFVQSGRHTVVVELDANGAVAETDERNNRWGMQWVYEPPRLLPNATRSVNQAPPLRYGGWDAIPTGFTQAYNCRGFRMGAAGNWDAVVLEPREVLDDFDLRLHEAATDANNGFVNHLASSSRPFGQAEVVFVNRRQHPGDDFDLGVVNFGRSDPGRFDIRHVTSEYVGVVCDRDELMPDGQVLAVREFRVTDPAQGAISIVVETTDPDVPLTVWWVQASVGLGGPSAASQQVITGEDGVARMDLDVGSAGYHALFVERPSVLDAGDLPWKLRIFRTPPDLVPHTASSWYAPVVPRPVYANTPFVVSAPTELYGEGDSWFALCLKNEGPMDASGVSTRVWIDGQLELTHEFFAALSGIEEKYFPPAPRVVAGGRHTVVYRVDDPHRWSEIDEGNNAYAEQWVWRPPYLDAGPAQLRAAVPSPFAHHEYLPAGSTPLVNQDGVRLSLSRVTPRPNWRGIATLPGDTTDVELRVYERSDDVKTGFTQLVERSSAGRGQLDYVLQAFPVDPATQWDIGLAEGPGGGRQPHELQVFESRHLGHGPGDSGLQVLAADDLAHAWEFTLEPGVYRVELRPPPGGSTVDWALALHRPDRAWHSLDTTTLEGLAEYGGPGEGESVVLVVDEGEVAPFCAVVFRSDAASAGIADSYKLVVGAEATGSGPPRALATALRGAAPNPFNPRTTVHFDLARPGAVELDVYSARGEHVLRLAGAEFPAGRHAVDWAGLDSRGQRVGSGVYHLRLRAGGIEEWGKLVLVK